MSSFEGATHPLKYDAIPLPSNGVHTCDDKLNDYRKTHAASIADPDAFWGKKAREVLDWFHPFDTVSGGNFVDGDIRWFENGKINVCYNCVDRHLASKADQTAIIWESDEPSAETSANRISYAELHRGVCRIANVLIHRGVRKGDCVTIYMPMIPELAMCMLACARIGAVHSVVFAGFSADSLRDRIVDCDSRVVITGDVGRRGGKNIMLKAIVDEAVAQTPMVSSVLVFDRNLACGGSLFAHAASPNGNTDNTTATTEAGGDVRNAFKVNMSAGRDLWMFDEMVKARPYCPCVWMDSEDPLFILYTSGSTGKPKGLAHTQAGYLLNAILTTKNSFDIQAGDMYFCAADCGWITGHTYIVYGPLGLGSTTIMFESVPTYPTPYRYWDVIQKYRVTQFYTAPTAVRTLMRFSPDPIAQYDLSSVRILGSVGEPINPEAWRWYNQHVGGNGRATIADTYWQTETGGHVCTNLPGATPMKPGSCALPTYGIEFAVLDATTGREITDTVAEGVLCIKKPWPSIARTVYGDHLRYQQVYTHPYKGYYFTGDGCRRDSDGYYWITGRVDDVINPSGHRIGTAEIESALITAPEVSESAVVGFPHEIKGEGIGCFIILREGAEDSAALAASLKARVRKAIGPIATPDFIVFSDLPKTRSGKIMRRILRKIASGEEDSIGDVSTLADPTAVERLSAKYKTQKH